MALLLATAPAYAQQGSARGNASPASAPREPTEGGVSRFPHGGVAAPEALDADDVMSMSLEELLSLRIFDQEVVSPSRKSQKEREAPAIIFVITHEQLRLRGVRTVGEALECVAGVDLIHDHSQYNLGIRGINGGLRASSRVVKVMIDGQPVSFRPSAEHFLGDELIPISVVERIEVIRGPASALYGANAFLGVINIITKNGGQVGANKAFARVGRGENTSLYGGELLVGGESGDFDYIAAGAFALPYETGYRLHNVPGKTHARQGEESEAETVVPRSYFGKLRYGNKHTIKIGFMTPIIELPALSQARFKIARLAMKEINDAGGVTIEDRTYALELVEKDTLGTPEGAVTAANQLVNEGVQFAIGPAWSREVLGDPEADPPVPGVAEAVAIPQELLLVSHSATSSAISDLDDNDLIWRACPPDEYQATVAAEYVLSTKRNTAGILFRNDAWGRGLAYEFRAEFEKGGGTVKDTGCRPSCRRGARRPPSRGSAPTA